MQSTSGRKRDQQVAGESFQETDLYAQVLKATEARLLLAIAAKHGCPVLKTDTQKAFLYGDMGHYIVYIRPRRHPGLVARTYIRRILLAARQKCIWDEAGSTQMAFAHFRMDANATATTP